MTFAPQVTAPDVTTPGQVTTSAPFTPTANGLQIVGGGVTGPLASQNSIAVSSTHAGQGAWTVIQWTTTAASQCSAFIAVSKTGPNPGSGTVSVSLGAAPVGESWFPSEIPDGFDPNNIAVGAASAGGGTTATTPAVTLTTAPAAGDIVLATFASRNDPNLVTPATGFTAVGQANGAANPRVSVLREWATGRTTTDCSAANMGTVYNAGAALIVKAAPGGGGTPTTAGPSGIGTAAVFGAVALAATLAVSPTGIGSGAGIGTPTASTSLTAAPAGITSAAMVGTPVAAATLTASPTGIGSAAAMGTPSALTAGSSSPTGIPSMEAFGSPTITLAVSVSPDGIASALVVGSPTITATTITSPDGIPSAEAVGVPSATITDGPPPPGARDLQLLSTTVPVLAWAAGGPVSGWTAAPPATDDLPTTTPASAWATSTPEH